LSQGIGTIAAAFYPKPVILRFSDFKSSEYSALLGGKHFEPLEDNPMIGWRGASRYYDPRYRDGFALECETVKRVRNVLGLTNLWVMIPFCRTIEEAKRTLAEMAKHGVVRGDDLKVIGMCEIPSNVILADEFLDIFDGYSIGSNDLTQLTLGVDRNSELVAPLFDERNEAVKKLISQVIAVALRKHKYIGICGQAPSDHIDFAEFLVRERIQSMSLNPDSVVSTILQLAKTEHEIDEQDSKQDSTKDAKLEKKEHKKAQKETEKAAVVHCEREVMAANHPTVANTVTPTTTVLPVGAAVSQGTIQPTAKSVGLSQASSGTKTG